MRAVQVPILVSSVSSETLVPRFQAEVSNQRRHHVADIAFLEPVVQCTVLSVTLVLHACVLKETVSLADTPERPSSWASSDWIQLEDDPETDATGASPCCCNPGLDELDEVSLFPASGANDSFSLRHESHCVFSGIASVRTPFYSCIGDMRLCRTTFMPSAQCHELVRLVLVR